MVGTEEGLFVDADVTRDPNPLLATLASLLAIEGNARLVASLAFARVSIEQTIVDPEN